jgi:aryl-alcohol dehydrogenase-like predicted oxidoreductase
MAEHHFFKQYICTMKKRRIGNTDLLVSPLALGGNVFGWTIDEKQSFAVLDHLVAHQFNFIDTADVYARWATGRGGESETIIGKWMKQRNNRTAVILATKVGMDMGDGKVGLSKKYIFQAVEDSLRRLQTDHIDLYQSHRDDERTPMEETLDAYQQLIKEGKIRYIGASNYTAARLQEALELSKKFGLPRYECLQPHYNLCERELFEKDLEKVCLQHGIGVIPYYALASGFLTGKYRTAGDSSKSIRGGGASRYLNEKGLQILKALDELALKYHVQPASVALAWLMARKSITAPIASATSIQQLNDLMRAAEIYLSDADIQLLDKTSQ